MKNRQKIMIVEDHTLVREGIKALIQIDDAYDIVCEAEDGLAAVRCAAKYLPHLILMDLALPKMNGIAAIKEIKKHIPDVKILVLTIHTSEEYIHEALKAGADGYCLKYDNQKELRMAVRSVLKGQIYLSPNISGTIVEGYLKGKQDAATDSAWNSLTQREKEILKMIGEGYSGNEIAQFLCISVKTVNKHRTNLMSKLNIRKASALTIYAMEKGLVTKSFSGI